MASTSYSTKQNSNLIKSKQSIPVKMNQTQRIAFQQGLPQYLLFTKNRIKTTTNDNKSLPKLDKQNKIIIKKNISNDTQVNKRSKQSRYKTDPSIFEEKQNTETTQESPKQNLKKSFFYSSRAHFQTQDKETNRNLGATSLKKDRSHITRIQSRQSKSVSYQNTERQHPDILDSQKQLCFNDTKNDTFVDDQLNQNPKFISDPEIKTLQQEAKIEIQQTISEIIQKEIQIQSTEKETDSTAIRNRQISIVDIQTCIETPSAVAEPPKQLIQQNEILPEESPISPSEKKKSPIKLFDVRAKLQSVLPKMDLHMQKSNGPDTVQKYPNIVFAEKIIHQNRIKVKYLKVFSNNLKKKKVLPSYVADKQFSDKSSMLQRKVLQHMVSKRAQVSQAPYDAKGKRQSREFDKESNTWSDVNEDDHHSKLQIKESMIQQSSMITKISFAQVQNNSIIQKGVNPQHQDSLKPLKILLEAIGENQYPKEPEQAVLQQFVQENPTPILGGPRRTIQIQIISTTNKVEQQQYEYPKHHVNPVEKRQSFAGSQSNIPISIIEEKIQVSKIQAPKKDNIYSLVSRAMINKKYVRRFKSCIEDIDSKNKKLEQQPQLFISPQSVQQYTKYYIQNQLIKTLEKTSDYDFDMLDNMSPNRVDSNEFKQVNNLYKENTQASFRSDSQMYFNKNLKIAQMNKLPIKQPYNIILAKIYDQRIQDDVPEDQSIQDTSMVVVTQVNFDDFDRDFIGSQKNLLSQQFDIIYQGAVFPIDKIKKTTLVPLLGELSELTRNQMIELSKGEEHNIITFPEQYDHIDIKFQEAEGLIKILSDHEQSNMYRNIKKKFESIINGLYEDQIVIFVNADTKHLILNCLVQTAQNQQDKLKVSQTSFKSSIKNTNIKQQPQQHNEIGEASIKVSVGLKKQVLSIIIPKPKPNETSFAKRLDTNTNTLMIDLQQQQSDIATIESKQSLLSPINKPGGMLNLKKYSQSSRNLFLEPQLPIRKAKKSFTRLAQDVLLRPPTIHTPDHLNETRIQERTPVSQIQRLQTQVTINESNNSFVKKNQKEPGMDKYSLVFRSMLISKSMQKNQNIYERMFRAIRENRIWEIEEIAVQNNFINYNNQDEEGNTFLILAAQAGYSDIVSFLLQKEADTGIKNNYGETALTKALEYQQFETADILFVQQKTETRKGV